MLDRQKLEALLANRFPGATSAQIAAAANAIVAMTQAAAKAPGDTESSRQRPSARAASGLPR